MNFIKSFFTSSSQTSYTQFYDFSILTELYQLVNESQKLICKNTELLFDKYNCDYDYLLIVRKQRISNMFSNEPGKREGDYYFRISQIKKITKTQIGNYSTLNCDIVDNNNKLEKFLFLFLNEDKQFNKFQELLSLLISENQQHIPYNKLKQVYIIKDEKRNPYPQLKKLPKQIKKQQQNKAKYQSLQQHDVSDNANELLTFLLNAQESIEVLFTGQLYEEDENEIRLINKEIVICVNRLQNYQCRLEIYNIKKQIIFIQDINDDLNYMVDNSQNYIKWIYNQSYDVYQIYLAKFDSFDGSVTIKVYIEKAKIQLRKQQEIKNEQGQEDNIIIQQQEQQQQYYYYDDNYRSIELKQQQQHLIVDQNDLIVVNNNIIFKYNKQLELTQEDQLQQLQQINKIFINQQDVLLQQQKQLQLYSKLQLIFEYPLTQDVITIQYYDHQYLILTSSQLLSLKDNQIKVLLNDKDMSAIKYIQSQVYILGYQQGQLKVNNKIVLQGEGQCINYIDHYNKYTLLTYNTHLTLIKDISNNPKSMKLTLLPDDLFYLQLSTIQFNIAYIRDIIVTYLDTYLIIWNINSTNYQIKYFDSYINHIKVFQDNIVVLLSDKLCLIPRKQ